MRKAAEGLKAKGAWVEIGGHTMDSLAGSSLVVLSPGVEWSSPVLKWAKESEIPITGEMELGYRFCKGRIIAVTGTNGKSTVTALIGEILKDAGLDAIVCGNIGNSLCGEIPRIKKSTWVVLEVSSFQLETIEEFKPHIAVILNITDDHLDRYKNFEDYFGEKLKIFRSQDENDLLILNRDAGNLEPLKNKARAKVLFYSKSDAGKYPYLGQARLKGAHNVENMLAAILAAKAAGAGDAAMRETIKNFLPLPHRFETVDVIDSVEYIDDSKGTTVDSTLRALQSCARPVILIAGGRDKSSDYSVIKDIVKDKVRGLVLIGEASAKIKSVLGAVVDTCEARSMEEAVRKGASLAKKGYIVLLSPMCSSFDMFTSYSHRGEVFKKAVGNLRMGVERCRR
jgi:UDP-N-acetylmuramoylalanine--D-glutamate ligase